MSLSSLRFANKKPSSKKKNLVRVSSRRLDNINDINK